MSDNIKENKEKIKLLGDQMISQLKNYSWTPIHTGFGNKHFQFQKDDYGRWRFKVIYSEYNSSNYLNVSDFISPIRFWYLRNFFVNKSLRNHTMIKNESELAGISQKFFSTHKDLSREFKLNKLLDEK